MLSLGVFWFLKLFIFKMDLPSQRTKLKLKRYFRVCNEKIHCALCQTSIVLPTFTGEGIKKQHYRLINNHCPLSGLVAPLNTYMYTKCVVLFYMFILLCSAPFCFMCHNDSQLLFIQNVVLLLTRKPFFAMNLSRLFST